MSLPAEKLAEPGPPLVERGKTGRMLLKRLADVVCLPSSRVNSFERSMTADLLLEVMLESSPADRLRVAKRLAVIPEIPAPLVRALLKDDVEIAAVILAEASYLSDSDLIESAQHDLPEHRVLMAKRRGLGDAVTNVLLSYREPTTIEALAHNESARLSQLGIDIMVGYSRQKPEIVPLLLRRPEVRPGHAYLMFWWADSACRRTILQRFAVSREVLHEVAGDLFPMAADEGWSDPVVKKALQFIERRQRNRGAIQTSPYDSLDAAIEAAGQGGLTRVLVEEIARLAGIRSATGARILADPGGEGLAILCKATGLPKISIEHLWKGLRRSVVDGQGEPSVDLERVKVIFDSIPVDRAQTVIRYWNWSLGSAISPALSAT